MGNLKFKNNLQFSLLEAERVKGASIKDPNNKFYPFYQWII